MKIERAKNAVRNIIYGVILKIYQILVPFIMRSVIIHIMGIQYLGLNSLFASILQVLNLAELGVGSAMVYSMYKPIAENDKKTISALLKLYKQYYFLIGLVIACIGILVIPFIPKLINEDLPGNLNIYILYLLNLSATVFTYWLFAYKNCLLLAYQRTDIISKINIIMVTIQYIIQFIALFIFNSYYLYLTIALCIQLIINILISLVVDKIYPEYYPSGNLDKKSISEINNRIKDLFTAKLGGTIVNSVDTLVISKYLGLTVLAIYQNYYFIMTSIIGFINIIFNSCIAGIGNSIITENIKKNYCDFKKLYFLINWISIICVCCFTSLYQPFMQIWTGNDYMFDFPIVILFCLYFYFYVTNQFLCLYKDAGGIWHEDKWRPFISSIINLILNITFVSKWGIYAILLSTIISYIFITMPWLVFNVFKYIFQKSAKEYIDSLFKYVLVLILAICLTCIFTNIIKMEGVFSLVVYIFISVIIGNGVILFVFKNDETFLSTIELLKSIFIARLKK